MNKKQIIYRILNRKEKLRKMQDERQFDSSPMGDIAFLLLIFFIVTSSFILRQGIFFSLPSKSAGSVSLKDNKIVEVYPQDSGFLYNDRIITREQLKEVLNEKKEKVPDSVLIIRMKPKVAYDRLVDTLSVAKETKIKRVSLKLANR